MFLIIAGKTNAFPIWRQGDFGVRYLIKLLARQRQRICVTVKLLQKKPGTYLFLHLLIKHITIVTNAQLPSSKNLDIDIAGGLYENLGHKQNEHLILMTFPS